MYSVCLEFPYFKLPAKRLYSHQSVLSFKLTRNRGTPDYSYFHCSYFFSGERALSYLLNGLSSNRPAVFDASPTCLSSKRTQPIYSRGLQVTGPFKQMVGSGHLQCGQLASASKKERRKKLVHLGSDKTQIFKWREPR